MRQGKWNKRSGRRQATGSVREALTATPLLISRAKASQDTGPGWDTLQCTDSPRDWPNGQSRFKKDQG